MDWTNFYIVMGVFAVAGVLWNWRDRREHYRAQADKRIRTFQGDIHA
jgi:hypothetical protein